MTLCCSTPTSTICAFYDDKERLLYNPSSSKASFISRRGRHEKTSLSELHSSEYYIQYKEGFELYLILGRSK